MSPACWASWAFATGCRPSFWPTRAAWSRQARSPLPPYGGDRRRQHPPFGRDPPSPAADDGGGRRSQTRRMPPIEIRNLSKRFDDVAAVHDLSFDVAAGRVTGFLGPNGAGKTTTLRALLGLVRPSTGSATFDGQAYDQLDHPSAAVGAVLEDASFPPGRTARNHLRVLATIGRHPSARVEEVLNAVGLSDAADRRVKGYSLGMRQRLAIASALLGDPAVLILDEPTNGLDPPGIAWVRTLLRRQATEGPAVLVSSHVLAEVAQSVDHVAVIAPRPLRAARVVPVSGHVLAESGQSAADVVFTAHAQLRAAGPLEEVLGADDSPPTQVRAHEPIRLAGALERRGHRVDHDGDVLLVRGATPEQVGQIAGEERVAVLGLAAQARSLEAAFMALTGAQA